MSKDNAGTCKFCGEQVVWMRTALGKPIPVDPETTSAGDTEYDKASGHVSHFTTCRGQDKWVGEVG